jgi:hypothetical protein
MENRNIVTVSPETVTFKNELANSMPHFNHPEMHRIPHRAKCFSANWTMNQFEP